MTETPDAAATSGGAPARRRPTSYDVARAAGVTQSTVSRCFRNESAISPATRAHVLETARRIGYLPNALARSLITRRSNMVGVIVTRYTLRANPDMIHAIGEALTAAGKTLLLVTAPRDLPHPRDLKSMLEYPLDGLISCVQLADAEIERIQARHIALVLYNRRSPAIPVDTVTTNHAAAAAEVAAALHRAGHRRFLCVSGPADAPVSRERMEGFVAGASAAGIAPPKVILTDFSYDGGHDAFLDAVKRDGPPDAVFCANDQIALGVMDACRFTLGLSIPGDISVVGFDDVAEASRPGYRLTTLRQESVDMARQAVELLLHRLAAPDQPVMRREISARLVVRGSARMRPAENDEAGLDPSSPA